MMKESLIFVFLVIILLCSSRVNAQQKLIDSLRVEVLREDLRPEDKVVKLSDLGKLLRYSNLDEAIRTGNEAIQLSWSLEDRQYATYAWSNMYYVYRKVENSSLIWGAIDSTLFYAEQTNNQIAKGLAIKTRGNYAWVLGDDDATPDLQQALELLDCTNMFEAIAGLDYMLTGIFSTNGNLQETEKYARHALKNAEISGNHSAQCIAGLCMGTFFDDKYRQTNESIDLDSALYYTNYTVDIFAQYEDVIKERFTGGTAALNHADYLWEHSPDASQATIFDYLRRSVLWSKTIKDWQVISRCYALMNDYYVQNDREDEAKYLMNSVVKILDEWKKR